MIDGKIYYLPNIPMKTHLPSLSIIALLLTSPIAHSEQASTEFDYISGGFQYTGLSHEFTSSHYLEDGKEGANTADSLAGAYVNASWNFTHRLYLIGEANLSKRNQFHLSHHNAGVGFYQPVSPSLTLFATLGIAHIELKQSEGIEHKNLQYSDSGTSAAVGLRYAPVDMWLVEPSFRTDQFNNKFSEYRLGNVFNVSNNMKIEANFSYSKIDKYTMSSYQLGVRYTY